MKDKRRCFVGGGTAPRERRRGERRFRRSASRINMSRRLRGACVVVGRLTASMCKAQGLPPRHVWREAMTEQQLQTLKNSHHKTNWLEGRFFVPTGPRLDQYDGRGKAASSGAGTPQYTFLHWSPFHHIANPPHLPWGGPLNCWPRPGNFRKPPPDHEVYPALAGTASQAGRRRRLCHCPLLA